MVINYLSNSFCCIKIYLVKSLTQLLPVKILVGKVNLSSIQTNLAPIKLGICFWYNLVYLLNSVLVLFNKHSISA